MPDSKYIMSSLDNALMLIEVLAEHKASTLTDLHSYTGFSRSSLFKMLYTLSNRGFVTKSDDSKYSLSTKFMHFGSAVLSSIDLYDLAGKYLKQLCRDINETTHMAVLTDDYKSILFMAKETSQRQNANMNVRMDSSIGRILPAHCTSLGKSILSLLPEKKIDEIYEDYDFSVLSVGTISSLSELKDDLALIRQRGYSIDDEEFEEGLYCIGCSVLDANGHGIAAISISGPKSRMKENESQYAGKVKSVADTISREMGYR